MMTFTAQESSNFMVLYISIMIHLCMWNICQNGTWLQENYVSISEYLSQLYRTNEFKGKLIKWENTDIIEQYL